MHHDRYRPTFRGTLRQQAAITRALWADYLDAAAARRRRARADRRYRLSRAPGWRDDVLFLVVVPLAVVCALLLVWLQVGGVL